MSEKRFKVALSFPGEKRKFVRKVAKELAAELGKNKVFYDEYFKAELAQPDLDLYLGNLYREQSELVVPFYCADYERKKWCNLEWRQMRDIIFNMEGSRVMPLRFDDTPIPGTLSIDGYANIKRNTAREVAELILQRVEPHSVGPKPTENKTANRKFWVLGTLGIIALLFLLLGIHHLTSQKSNLPNVEAVKAFPPDVTGVLILKIDGDHDGSLQSQLISTMDAELAKDQINDTILLRGCNESVDEKDGLAEAHKRARGIGEKYGAALVVWGNKAGDSRFFPRLTTVHPLLISRDRTFQVQDIREVELPAQTINQPLFLAHFLAGFSFWGIGTAEFALKHFEAARELSEPGSEDRAFVQLSAGLLHSISAQKNGLGFSDTAVEELSSAADAFQQHGAGYSKYYGMAQANLGLAYAALGKGRDLNRSIIAYKAALTVYNETNNPNFWACVQNGLGTDYCELKTAEGFKNAIDAFQSALRGVKTETDPGEWATVENGLGYAYANLPTGDLDENLDHAISCCELSLGVVTEKHNPIEWSDANHYLGAAYLNLRRGDKGENIQRAISCLRAALRVDTKGDWPLAWADIQIRLSEAYSELPTGDPLSNLNEAISARQSALTIYTEVTFPEDWATTQGDLAALYLRLPNCTGATNALIAATNALEVLNENKYPEQWAKTQLHLAQAYSQLAKTTPAERVENLKSVIAALQAGSRIFTEKEYPDQWASDQKRCGEAYGMIGQYAESIECLKAALRVVNEQKSPLDWASIQFGLGVAYASIPGGDRRGDLSRAKVYILNALGIPSFANAQNREIANKILAEIERELNAVQTSK